MNAEQKARQKIDQQLQQAGWVIQDIERINLGAGSGIAVREYPVQDGYVDYLLVVDRQAVGVVEAKSEGTTLSGVAEQSERYLGAVPEQIPHVSHPLPFAYESTGVETFFRNSWDPEPRSRRVFSFHQPETLREWVTQPDTLRARLQNMPPLRQEKLWDCQREAIINLEHSLTQDKPRALIQMATGSGKTFTAVSFIYRLLKYAKARRVLFLVDRYNLGKQTHNEFQQFITPDDGRKFTELYNVQHLTSNQLDQPSRVCISTIQRLYSMLKGEELEPEVEEQSLFEMEKNMELPAEVAYNPKVPIETFDFIITDECHRSIYNLWRQVLEYFDAHIIGLTATPSKQTLGFFNQNLVMEYSHERAVAEGVNVGYDVYRIQTEITEKGSTVEAGFYIDKRDKKTRQLRWEMLDEEMAYTSNQLDRDVVSPDQIRTIIRTFKEKLFTDIFPDRQEVPKTLIFAKNDAHAEDIVHIVREEFGKGNEFCKKITYRTEGQKPEDLIKSFRNSYHPRIAVTVDMVSTGTDIRPLECLLFMRDMKSRVYFEQAKGRGTRTVKPADFKAVTPDAHHKTHFIIVDTVGVCERDKTDSRPLERKQTVSFDRLLDDVAKGLQDTDTLTSLANRLARLDRQLSDKDREEIQNQSGDKTLPDITSELLDAVDPDKQEEKAREKFGTDSPTEDQKKEASREMAGEACRVFDSPDLRDTLKRIKKKHEQIIDNVSQDSILFAGFDDQAKDRAQEVVDTFKKFIVENQNELTALQIIYSRPYGQRQLTYDQIKELAGAIQKPPYGIRPEQVWQAYEQLEQAKVKGAGPQRLLTDIISLVRYASGQRDELRPFTEEAEEKFQRWLQEQKEAGREFTYEQLEWLNLIKRHIGSSGCVEKEDFEYAPFSQKGGLIGVHRAFGDELDKILDELNEVLIA